MPIISSRIVLWNLKGPLACRCAHPFSKSNLLEFLYHMHSYRMIMLGQSPAIILAHPEEATFDQAQYFKMMIATMLSWKSRSSIGYMDSWKVGISYRPDRKTSTCV